MFGFFFGVRRMRDEEQYGQLPIAANRGLPDDANWITRLDSNELDTDGHSHTWIKLSEIENIDWNKCQGKIAEFVNANGWKELVEIMEMFDDGTDNVRLVVWFDN